LTITVKKSQEARYNLDPVSFFVNHFWGRRPDGVTINEFLQIVCILEFKRSTDFLEVKEAGANDQHKSIIGAFKAAAPKWEFEQINFVVGNRGSVVESNFYTKLKKLDVQEEKQALHRLCHTGMRSTQSGDCVLPPAGARRYEANHKGIKGEHRARVRR